MERPSMSVSPEVGSRYPHIILMVVLLPAPLGPSRPKISPPPMVKDTPLTASCLSKVFFKLRTSTYTERPSVGWCSGPVVVTDSVDSCKTTYSFQTVASTHKGNSVSYASLYPPWPALHRR